MQPVGSQIKQARKQYAGDSEPLPKGTYEELTAVAEYQEDGITITERRYLDPRLEIRTFRDSHNP